MKQKYVGSRQAAEMLGVKIETLYSYVSRQLIQSELIPGTKKERMYLLSEVEEFKKRRLLQKSPKQALQQVLDWGSPILQSNMSHIENGNLFFKNQSLQEIVTTCSFEELISLLWQKPLEKSVWSEQVKELEGLINLKKFKKEHKKFHYLQQVQLAMIQLSQLDARSHLTTHRRSLMTSIKIILVVVYLACEEFPCGDIVSTLAYSWGIQKALVSDCIKAALMVAAEHEMNTSTFTGRCVASTQANLYEVVNACCAAFSGVKHGGVLVRIEEFWSRLAEAKDIPSMLSQLLKQQEKIDGFYHPLYPQGDPRAKILLDKLKKSNVSKKQYKKLAQVLQFFAEDGVYPVIDFALIAAEHCLELPAGAATQLFIIGRTMGWLAHAMEQYQLGIQVRPRSS